MGRVVCKPFVAQKPSVRRKDPAYLAKVRRLPCCICGRYGVEAHHCRDLPDFSEQGLYEAMPGAAQKSSDLDAIPLCPDDHRLFHERRSIFHKWYGKDYQFIGPTRAAISDVEVDF